MSLKTIKNVNDRKWADFKSMAAKHRVPMGKLLESMVDAYSKTTEEEWNKILYGERGLSDKEADELRKETADLRKGKWFKE